MFQRMWNPLPVLTFCNAELPKHNLLKKKNNGTLEFSVNVEIKQMIQDKYYPFDTDKTWETEGF